MWSGASAVPGREVGSGAPEWLLGRDRPDEAGEFAGAGDDDLLVRFAAAGHPLPALVEALLAAPGALDHDGVLAALAAGELVADRRPAACVPGRLDSSRRTWLLPTLVIEPGAARPEECSEGTRPTKAMNCSALWKRLKSPISVTSASAVSVSIPRKQRSRAANSCHGLARPSRGSPAPAARSARRPGRPRADRCRTSAAGRQTRTAARQATCAESPSKRWPAAGARGAGKTSTAGAGRASDRDGHPHGRGPDRGPPPAPAKHMDRLQQPAREQPRQLARIARVGLDPIARPLRHQPRRDHRAVDPPLNQVPVETEAGRPGLVPAAHPRPAPQQPRDRLLVVGQRPLLQQFVAADRSEPDRARVDVQPNGYRRRVDMVGDLRMWLYRATPGNPRQMRRRRPLSASNRTPRPPRATAPSCLMRPSGLTFGGPDIHSESIGEECHL